jgi:hypothetical protein
MRTAYTLLGCLVLRSATATQTPQLPAIERIVELFEQLYPSSDGAAKAASSSVA